MKKIEIKRDALAHYDRMIVWAEKRRKNAPCASEMMDAAIGEYWGAEACVYCRNYECPKCPLGESPTECCKSLWKDMNEARTWKTWVKRAKLVRQYIEDNG